jgi:hypothetical protein
MLINAVSRISKWYHIVLFFSLSFWLQFKLVGDYLPLFLKYSQGIKNPDQLFWYSSEWLQALYQNLGSAGRSFYVEMLLLDFVYLSVTSLALLSLLYVLTRETRFTLLFWLPLIAAGADVLENLCQIILLNTFPEQINFFVTISSMGSLIKMLLMMVIIVAVLLMTGYRIFFWIKGIRSRKLIS